MKNTEIREIIGKAQLKTKSKKKGITFLTGAGISAESGVPTYRGAEGYWVKGSENYRPEEVGTFRFFQAYPEEIWQFTLFRKNLLDKQCPMQVTMLLLELNSN